MVAACPSSRASCRLVVVPEVHGAAAAVPSVARICHCSSRALLASALRTERSTKLFVQSTAVSEGAAIGVRPVPLKVAVPRWTATPAANSAT